MTVLERAISFPTARTGGVLCCGCRRFQIHQGSTVSPCFRGVEMELVQSLGSAPPLSRLLVQWDRDCFQSVIEDLLCRLSITHQHQPSHIQQRPAAYQAATRAIRRWGGRIAADRFSVEGRRRQGSNEREAEAVSVLCWHVQER
eukprot:scaffold2849_cov203-Alexandrium_tamarense.AAC.22